MNAAAQTAPTLEKAAVAGYVEAATTTAVLGWAWSPGSPDPLDVELRLGSTVLARATADTLRDDLARSGIGEGRHAFTLPVPPDARPRLPELRVFAIGPDNEATALGAPPAEDGFAERLSNLQRGMEMLVGSQRVLHRNLQAALLARAEAAPAAAPAAVQADIAALELFVTRLERALAAQPATPPPAHPGPAQPRWALAAIAIAAAASLVLSLAALVRVMPEW